MMETMMITTALMTEKLMQIAAMTDTMWLALPS
jgi:BarA-like signal transduction histidine kinase